MAKNIDRVAVRAAGWAQSSDRAGRRGRPPADNDRDTEASILAAARRVFLRRGSAGARMHEIAAEADVNPALLHYYFRSKDALARAVFREAAQRLFPVIFRIIASDAPLEQRVTQVVHHYIDVLRENPFLPGYVLSEMHFHGSRVLSDAMELASPGRPDAVKDALTRLDRELVAKAKAGDIRPIRVEQFITNLASLCVFPFAARPMLGFMLGIDDEKWERYLNTRRAELPGFILNALQP